LPPTFLDLAVLDSPTPDALALHVMRKDGSLDDLPISAAQKAMLGHLKFSGEEGAVQLLFDAEGTLTGAVLGLGSAPSMRGFGAAALKLPEGRYQLTDGAINATDAAFNWALGAYQFTRYRKASRAPSTLCVEAGARERASLLAQGVFLARDLINTPAEDMGPSALAAEIDRVGAMFDAKVSHVVGDDLLEQNYPLVHAVGRTATDAPRLAILEWGAPGHPKVSLVGKGVTFDTGGLNLKPGNFMALMKKDMGGAATALGLAQMIMASRLAVRLQLIIPMVENAIGGGAFRPGDVYPSRKGLTVEIENTDAEGRLILADALTRACEDSPELLIDFATLTGAARVALGPDLAPVFTDDEALSCQIVEAGRHVDDLCWPLPLHMPYLSELDSRIADICHSSPSGMAGSITAALFLRRFVEGPVWVHFDIFGWNPKAGPARPLGGEMLGARAVFAMLEARYRTKRA
jgi:leucyl aminopeptidase